MSANPNRSFRLVSLPGVSSILGGVPYLPLFYDALKPYGIMLVNELNPDPAWIRDNNQHFDAIHLHWPEQIWRAYDPPCFSKLRERRGYFFLRRFMRKPLHLLGLQRLRSLLDATRQCGKHVIWTVHDIEPHSRPSAQDLIGYKTLANNADLLICHSKTAKDSFTERYGSVKNMVVMPHGNFKGVYPEPRSRAIVLRELGLAEHIPVVCLLGALRKYKGIDLALDAASRLKGKVQFIIAGSASFDFSVADLLRRISVVPNAKIIPRHLSPQEFADFGGSSEAFLLPYEKITTSGIMHAAFTLGCGVVCSNQPYFVEALAKHSDCGAISELHDAESYADAILRYLAIPKSNRQQATRRFANETDWDRVVFPVVDAIHAFQCTAQNHVAAM